MKFTTVVGLDYKHLLQLSHTWPTWKKHKPELLENPMLIFIDRYDDLISVQDVREKIDHPDLTVVIWPLTGAIYESQTADKWNNPQRYKMLAGFVHMAAEHVKTKYWLKIDTDTIATGFPDWIDETWFENDPAIVAQKWTFTKPADQVLKLDEWVLEYTDHLPLSLTERPPLALSPMKGWSRLNHPRIISWCGFFNTDFTKYCSLITAASIGRNLLPVKSQDGFMWYVAKRLDLGIERVNFKSRGWLHRSSMRNIQKESAKALE